ncbi:MAG: beta-N-acetylhexosaminidase [Chlamydiales bacterium]
MFQPSKNGFYRTLSTICYLVVFIIVSDPIMAEEAAERYPLIPNPVSLIPEPGFFTVHDELRIIAQPNHVETQELVSYVSDHVYALWGVKTNREIDVEEGNLTLLIDEEAGLDPEEYYLTITPDSIVIKANNTVGAFWAFQTLFQLVSGERYSPESSIALTIPCVAIHDFPRFPYRGLHLDVARHMFPVEFIKKYIDIMARYKLNKFHWHLTDDQGWRIEIKNYPKLQEIGAWRNETALGYYRNWLNRLGLGWLNRFDGEPYGGYYTQDEIKEVVEYARRRHITVIPEIELPGHCLAALAAYPDLGCRGGNYQTATHWGILDDLFCAGNEESFEFLEHVLTEVLALFPSEFIHIGGDEVRKARWKSCPRCQERMRVEGLRDENELQSYFITRIEKFLNSKQRQIIGWDEILEGGIAPNAVVMSWRGEEGGIKAALLGHYAIMTPTSALYFDYYQSTTQTTPLPVGKYLPLQKVYDYDPVPKTLTEEQAKFILGAQANVWTEYLKTPEDVEYMIFPRVAALAEIVWTPASEKNYSNFSSRLKL